MDDTESAVSYHHRQIASQWKFYKNNPLPSLTVTLKPLKTYKFWMLKNIGQVKQAAQILAQLSTEELRKTAVILADEACYYLLYIRYSQWSK